MPTSALQSPVFMPAVRGLETGVLPMNLVGRSVDGLFLADRARLFATRSYRVQRLKSRTVAGRVTTWFTHSEQQRTK